MQESGSSNNVIFGDKAVDFLGAYLKEKQAYGIFVLVDDRTIESCWPRLISLCEGLEEVELLQIGCGESEKNLDVCSSLWSALTELGANRKSVLINLGGGVITDMGGFVASCFKRGIEFINIPTTLLAQVDAAIGGKTGVDLGVLKNQIGLFSEPKATLIIGAFLETLDARQWKSGFAEIIKYGLALDVKLWEDISKTAKLREWDFMQSIIKRSVEIKMNVVDADPFEKSDRKKLNFGHTIGHALESFLIEDEVRSLLHGEAVALGMIGEMHISTQKQLLQKSELELAQKYILKMFPMCPFHENEIDAIIALCKHDKKNVGDTINCTLTHVIGTSGVDHLVNEKELRLALIYVLNIYGK
jgi:3-dehydroquinate synthase